jgi:hypothetical protein
MSISRDQFRDITRAFLEGFSDDAESQPLTEEKATIMENPQQMTFNQQGVDTVLNMAKQIEPMFEMLRQTAGQSQVAHELLYEELENILLDLPIQLEEIAEKMKKLDPVQGGM